MKRFLAALMLMAGLFVADGASAVDRGNFSADCSSGGYTDNTVVGDVGDTFTITVSGIFCDTSLAGLATGLTPLPVGGPYVFTFTAAGSGTLYFARNSTNGLRLAATVSIAPAPAAVPTLREWAQLMLALMVIGVAWHFHNKEQNSY